MLAFLKRRVVLVTLGLLLLAVFVWFAGPYLFRTATWAPLEGRMARAFAIALIVMLWLAWELFNRSRANKASDDLMAAVVKGAPVTGGATADALKMRERFEEAVAGLKQNRRGGHTLYDLPWYIIIGAPGAGKTTALVHSGLHFPVQQRGTKPFVKGIGGTRNCDWWFTDEAVFLDTAGRYFTQDSDAATDSAGWTEFLALLRKYRRRRPVNGVLVAISAHDLMVEGETKREDHIAAARRRLNELNEQLGIQLPVYVLVTKCDLLSGFTEYLADLSVEGRAQVWGVTFPYEQTRNSEAASGFPNELDALVARLNERVFERVEGERDFRRRARVFGFPQQIASLRDALGEFVTEVFTSTRFDRTILLRGVYFTSGTQEGTPIDRVLGALGRRLAMEPEAVLPGSRGKAYFIERLLKEVVIPESGLAGVNRRVEMKKAASQLGAYVAMIAVGVLGLIALTVSWRANGAYVRGVGDAIATLSKLPAIPPSSPLEQMLPRLNVLDAISKEATKYDQNTPWRMRWGLYQGSEISAQARQTYVDELAGPLIARLAAAFKARLNDATDQITLYRYLKGYLILAEARATDPTLRAYALSLAQNEWGDQIGTGPRMLEHLGTVFDRAEKLPTITADKQTESLISAARSEIRRESLGRLAYDRLRGQAVNKTTVEAEVRRVNEVLRRNDGASWSAPILDVYTVEGFELRAQEDALFKEIDDLADEQWVFGKDSTQTETKPQIALKLLDDYASDYIRQWDAILTSIDIKAITSQTDATDTLGILSAEKSSPLRGVFSLVAKHTSLMKPQSQSPSDAASVASAAATKAGVKIPALPAGLQKAKPLAEGARKRITDHFAEIHKLVGAEGAKAPIDDLLAALKQFQEKLKAATPGLAGGSPLDPQIKAALDESARELKSLSPDLPASLREAVLKAVGQAMAAAGGVAIVELRTAYELEVGNECRELVGNKYPLAPARSEDAQLVDFGEVFGYNGRFDKFFNEKLKSLVEIRSSGFVWRQGLAPPGPQTLLDRFTAAKQIRDSFFPQNDKQPQLTFGVLQRLDLDLDDRVKLFRLEIEGETKDYQHRPDETKDMVWPGKKAGSVTATFYLGNPAGTPPIIEHNGPWALFRLLSDSRVRVTSRSAVDHVVRFEQNGYYWTLALTAKSQRNAIAQRGLLQRFRC